MQKKIAKKSVKKVIVEYKVGRDHEDRFFWVLIEGKKVICYSNQTYTRARSARQALDRFKKKINLIQ